MLENAFLTYPYKALKVVNSSLLQLFFFVNSNLFYFARFRVLLYYLIYFCPTFQCFMVLSKLNSPLVLKPCFLTHNIQEQIACWLIGPKSRKSWLNCFPNSRERSTGKSAFCKSVAEPRAEEPKLNCLPEPELKLRIAAQVPFYLPQTSRNFIVKKWLLKKCL